MVRRSNRVSLIIFVALLFSPHIQACGTLQNWIDAYYNRGVLDDKNKKEALVGIYKCGRFYYQEEDKQLLAVIRDALHHCDAIDTISQSGFADEKREYSQAGRLDVLLERIFRRYECLKRAKELPDYTLLAKRFGTLSCFANTTQRMQVHVNSTAIIREIPKGRKIGYLTNNVIVHVIGYEGEWVKVNVPGNINDAERIDVGYMHSSLLSPME